MMMFAVFGLVMATAVVVLPQARAHLIKHPGPDGLLLNPGAETADPESRGYNHVTVPHPFP